MSLTFKATSSILPPLGLYVGKLTDIEDLGIQTGGQYGDQHQVRLLIQLTDILDSEDEETAEGYVEQGTVIFAYANLSFGPRSKLRKWCQAIAGREIEDGDEFSAREIIGKAVRFTIAENTVGNPTVADIAGYRKAKSNGRKRAKPVDEDDLEDDRAEDF